MLEMTFYILSNTVLILKYFFILDGKISVLSEYLSVLSQLSNGPIFSNFCSTNLDFREKIY